MADDFDVHEAEAHLDRLLERVAAGERITISREGHPVADLIPHRRGTVRVGGLRGRIHDEDADFDEPDPDIQRMFDVDATA